MRLSRAADRKIDWTPVIGVTASLTESARSAAHQPLSRLVQADLDYVEGVIKAGGVPMILPPVVEPQMAEVLLDGIDGLLLSGGRTSIRTTTVRSAPTNSALRTRSVMPSRWLCCG
jgi:gamma-glutamyl-gamma-aminobutyrate hydrolase PuuD